MSKPINGKHVIHDGIAKMNEPTELERRLEEQRGGLPIEIGKLSPQPDDVVIVRVPHIVNQPDLLRGILETVQNSLPGGVYLLGLFEGVDLEHVPAPEMAQAGWVPAESVRKLVDAARTTGGTAGRDDELCAALDAVEALLPPGNEVPPPTQNDEPHHEH